MKIVGERKAGRALAALAAAWITGVILVPQHARAQEQSGEQSADAAAEPLNGDELEILVARIALYPDELVAVISAASLYPLQIVEAARFLDAYEKDPSLEPKESWDGSVISLLNYPEIVGMMGDDLDWTQQLAQALAYQQKDVLIAIQQLREEAVAKGIIKSDEKVKVETSNDNIVIQSTSAEAVYVPRYEPEMLYVPDYAAVPVTYYPDPYPNYWYPTATFFAGAVTGAVWSAAVDWDDWGVWGGPWRGDVDLDIDCDHCLNNISGKVNFRDVDWKNVDRSRIKIDSNKLASIDRSKIKNDIKLNRDNSIKRRASEIKSEGLGRVNRPGKPAISQDIRKNTFEGLKGSNPNFARPGGKAEITKPAGERLATRPSPPRQGKPDIRKPSSIERPVSRPKPAARIDSRPVKPSALGGVDRGKVAKVQSNRGQKALRGGGAGKPAVKRPAGRRR